MLDEPVIEVTEVVLKFYGDVIEASALTLDACCLEATRECNHLPMYCIQVNGRLMS